MQYKQLDQETQDDYLAEAMYSRELEFFHYDFDRQNFQRIADSLPPGKEKDEYLRRVESVNTQVAVVEAVYTALSARVTNPAAHVAAVARTKAKRDAAAAKG
jgi:hypothetical protein